MSTSTKSSSQSNRIIFLDYLRIFAFVTVLVGHKFYAQALAYVGNPNVHVTPRLVLGSLLPFFVGGGAGIVAFFLVSGYIITLVLQTEHIAEFAVKRIFRIYPLYIVAVFLEIWMKGSFPDLSILIPRLLLVGDFFNTPYALADVEWTLRIEVLFYVYMGVLRSVGLVHRYQKWLPWVFLVSTLALAIIPPMPSSNLLARGYVTIYTPFLLVGAMFLLMERAQISVQLLLAFVGVVLFRYYHLIETVQPNWIGEHFATLSLLIFAFAWKFQSHFIVTPVLLFLSDLTYAIYLFHNWIWDFMAQLVAKLSLPLIHPDIQVVILLVLFCALMVKLVEKPGIRLGRKVLMRLNVHKNADGITKAYNT